MKKEQVVLSAQSAPRPRKTNNVTECPLAQVRQAVELTQPHFAARLGVSLSTIKSLERGAMPCSVPMAAKVEYIFGADRKSLLTGTQARTFTGQVYTSAFYGNWKKMIEVDDGEAAVIAEKAAEMVRDIILAANRQKKIFAALAAFEEFSLEYIRESKIVPSLKMVMGPDMIPLYNPTFIALRYILEKRRKASKPKPPASISAPSKTAHSPTKKPTKKK
jgi:transcriptional regulator with XRE-family HTH domain